MKRLLYICVLLLCGVWLLTGCNKEEIKPEDRMKEYVNLWNKQQYSEMYPYLSMESKKSISKDEFVERYEKIYGGIETKDLKVALAKAEKIKDLKDREQVKLGYSVEMDTIAGPINYSHQAKMVKEKDKEDETNWYFDWNSTHIFPELEEGDKVAVESYPAIRGEIVDRDERGLAMNGSVFEVGMVPEEMAGNEAGILAQASGLLGLTKEEIEKKLSQKWVKPNYVVPIKQFSIDDSDLINQLEAIPSISVTEVDQRIYPYKEAVAHLIGYVGAASAEDLEKLEGKGYTADDIIGKRGLEQIFEERLKGKPGAKVYIKAENGSERTLAEIPAEEGETIQLTIDADLQQSIYAQYSATNDVGSAAAIHPITGETLALVSSPSFDPNKFVLGMSNGERSALENNPNKPLLNRFSSIYTPGSTIKPLTAAVSLENGVDPAQKVDIKGKQWSKPSWKDHSITRVKDPGTAVNMTDALVYSDNIYFAQKALWLGTQKFAEGLQSFGFEQEMPFEYPIKASSYGSIDSEGRLADSGYGQGQVQMSTLHLALTYAAFLNEGKLLAPTLMLDSKQGQVWKEKAVTAETAAKVLEMTKEVVNNPSGSGHLLSDLGIPFAGKSGTAETKAVKGAAGAENGWFVAMNTENPEILLAMNMDNIKGGSRYVVGKMKPILAGYIQR